MTKLTESRIEQFVIELLEQQGYHYFHGNDVSMDAERPERDSFEDVFLKDRLRQGIARINPHIPASARDEAFKDMLRISSPELIVNNETCHRFITEGIPVTYQKDGNSRGDRVWPIDFDNPENNEFLVINQFTVIENNINKRPDVILFINGLPVVVIELKNPGDENATVRSAFRQIQTYKETIPSLFTANGFIIISDGLEARAGTISAGFSRFMPWKTADGKKEASNTVSQIDTLIKGMLNKTTLLDLLRHFIVFEKGVLNKPVTMTEKDTKSHYRGGLNFSGLVKQCRELRKNQTNAEEMFWEYVKNKKFMGLKFRRQHQIGNYIADFYCHSHKLVIELDGEPHNHTEQIKKDKKRDKYLESMGNTVLRFPNNDILNSPETVLQTLSQIISPSGRDKREGSVMTVNTMKKLSAYHQYYAVNRAVQSTLRASGFTITHSPPLEGWQTKSDGVVPSLGEQQHEGSETGVVHPLEGQSPHAYPQNEGWSIESNRVAQRDAHNYFALPYNPDLKKRAKELRKAENLPEVLLWQRLNKKQFKGYDFDRQKIIGDYIVDFYCSNCHVVLEVDGPVHEKQKEYDERRDRYLESLGLTIIHIPSKDVLKHLDDVIDMLSNHPALQGPAKVTNSLPELPFTQDQPVGDRKGGVVWHTQGSGKSLSMVFYTGKLVLAMNNPTVVVITDRNDLDDQLFDTFAASRQLLRQEPVQAENRDHLKTLLKVASGGIVFTTIQKFQPDEGNVFEVLSERENIVVIADEAHRTQYGFHAKTVDDKDEEGNIIGKKVVYGFAKYLRDALPNATYLGFTGTPIEKTDVNTPAVFGNYVDIYDIAQAVEDNATVRIFYESRLAKIQLTEEGKQLVKELDDRLELQDQSDVEKAKTKWTQLEALIGSDKRIRQVAEDIIAHFDQRQAVCDGKGMIVAMSRRIAADLYEAIIALKPEWHNEDLAKGALKVVMTASSSDGPKMAKHHTTKDQRRALADRMKNPDDELKLVIVRDMWLTGFDAPSLHTMYIDKPMKGHNLMQAIARVNRVYKDKPGGLIVDYLGIASDLKKALSFYSDSGGKGDPATTQEQAVQMMLEKLEVVSQMYHDFEYEHYFDADTGTKLSLILQAEEHILGLENGKRRYINEVNNLSQAFAIAIPHDKAMDVKEEVAFFQAVKARLVKFDSTGTGSTSEEIETAIRQVIDQALVSEQVIDVFDAAGIKKPDISILSEEFLMEVKNMEHKNIAMETLKKLINDEIKVRMKTNLVQSRSLSEMLENAIKNYHNKVITAAEVIDELIEIAKNIKHMDTEPGEMGLTDYEYAFYTAVADNDSARELMEKDKLRELAVVLFEKVKSTASIDWTIKESVKAKMRVAVRRTLRQYGYPPDMQQLATETVLKQAELLAQELTG